ncbi:MAG: HEPN domain-containing protein [Oligoflexia bacterium]|nr:HEPN domain-containing protein [Oligoflexia bacterium]
MTNFRKWFDRAKYDLGTAKDMLKMGRLLYVMFMCQQTLEKGLKAYYLFYKKEIPPYIHNLVKLSDCCELKSSMTREQIEILERLNPFYITARYPEDHYDLEKICSTSSCQEVLTKTEELLTWIEAKMKY